MDVGPSLLPTCPSDDVELSTETFACNPVYTASVFARLLKSQDIFIFRVLAYTAH